jgi:hypothetical protein
LLPLRSIRFAFDVPFHGNLLVVFCVASLCILSGIALDTVIATFSRSAQQAQLTSLRDRALQHDQGHRLHALVAQLFGTGPFHSHDGSAERLAYPQNAQLSRDETGRRKSFARTVKLALRTQAP